jgi:hypothetical protein
MSSIKKQVERLTAFTSVASSTVLLGSALLLSGCDLTEEENLGRLPGSWQVRGLSVDGTSVSAQLDARYDRLVLTLRRGAGGRDVFSLTGRRAGEDSVLAVQGTFDKDGSELTLTPRQASGRIKVDYTISSVEGTSGSEGTFGSGKPSSSEDSPPMLLLELQAEEGRSEDALLGLIRLPIQGTVDQVRVHLSK